MLLFNYPEYVDTRIGISRYQYDYYLNTLAGENSSQKILFISGEIVKNREIIDNYEMMNEKRANDEISVDEWTEYLNAYDEATMRASALAIFREKARDFAALLSSYDVAPPHYFYEYEWLTVFDYYKRPDFLLLFVAMVLASITFAAESFLGTMPLLRSAKNGRGELFVAKALALSSVVLVIAVVSGVMDVMVFEYRFSLANGGDLPLYSLASFRTTPIPLTIYQGYAAILFFRASGALIVAWLCMELSIILKNAINSLFVVGLLIAAPLLIEGLRDFVIALTPTGLLTGVHILLLYQQSFGAVFLVAPFLTSALLVGTGAYVSYKVYVRASR
jgi:hypothetical protein